MSLSCLKQLVNELEEENFGADRLECCVELKYLHAKVSISSYIFPYLRRSG